MTYVEIHRDFLVKTTPKSPHKMYLAQPKETSWEIDSRKRVKENIDESLSMCVGIAKFHGVLARSLGNAKFHQRSIIPIPTSVSARQNALTHNFPQLLTTITLESCTLPSLFVTSRPIWMGPRRHSLMLRIRYVV